MFSYAVQTFCFFDICVIPAFYAIRQTVNGIADDHAILKNNKLLSPINPGRKEVYYDY